MADVINPAYLSMPAQVQKNKDDIEALRNSAFVATPAGQYSATTTYGKGALVAYTDGNIYYHFSDTETQGVPPTDTANWVIYQEGIPGPQGEPGQTGAPGEPGAPGAPGTNGSNGYPIYLVTSDYTTSSNRVYKTSIKTPAGYPAPISGSIVYFQNGYLATLETDYGDYWTLNESVINVNGQTGGQTGAAALTYGGTASASSIPVRGNTLQFVNHYFNRTPETGDRFIAFVVYSTSNYICGMRVTEAGSVTMAVIETVVQMETSAKKYIHYATFQLENSTSHTAYISLNILTDIPVKFTTSSLLSILTTISDGKPIPVNGVLQAESSPPTKGSILWLQPSGTSSVTVVYYDGDTEGLQTMVFSPSIAVKQITDIVIATS